MTPRPYAPSVLLALILVGLGGACASGGKPVAVQATEAAAEVLLPVPEENKLGLQMAGKLDTELTLHPDADVQAYVRGLGE